MPANFQRRVHLKYPSAAVIDESKPMQNCTPKMHSKYRLIDLPCLYNIFHLVRSLTIIAALATDTEMPVKKVMHYHLVLLERQSDQASSSSSSSSSSVLPKFF